jgi:hypothetical protein
MTATKPQVKKYIPDLRLAKVVKLSGGKLRGEAVKAAKENVESLRDVSIDGIEAALRETEDLLHKAQSGYLTKDQLIQIQELADRVVTLSGTFGYARLFDVARSLCELASLLLADEVVPAGPLLVHVHAAWLFAPRASALPEGSAQSVLTELGKVLEYFGLAAGAETAAANDKHG